MGREVIAGKMGLPQSFGNNRTNTKCLLVPDFSLISESRGKFFCIERDCQKFVAGMTRRFVSAKKHVRYFSELVEHRALSPVRQVKMLAGWPFSDSH